MLQVTVSTTNTATNTGTATAVASGGTTYTYAWTKNGVVIPSATTASLTGLSPAVYYCTVISGTAKAGASGTVACTTLLITTAPSYMTLQWPPVTNAKAYAVVYSSTSSTTGFKTLVSEFHSLSVTIPNLTPLTTYYVKVQSKVNGSYVTSFTGSATLPANTAAFYNKASIPVTAQSSGKSGSETVYDITSVQTTGAVSRDVVMTSLLQTGDLVSVNAQKPGTTQLIKGAKMLSPTESIPVTKNGVFYVPVTTAGQVSNLVLSNSTVQPVTFNASSVVVNGTTYNVGTTFIMDGQNVEVRSA